MLTGTSLGTLTTPCLLLEGFTLMGAGCRLRGCPALRERAPAPHSPKVDQGRTLKRDGI